MVAGNRLRGRPKEKWIGIIGDAGQVIKNLVIERGVEGIKISIPCEGQRRK